MTETVQLRSTDRTIFKQCRQKWDFASVHRRNMHPRAGIKAFEFGTAVHAALEVYYDPNRWWMPATTRMLAGVAEYLRLTAEQMKQIERNIGGPLDPELKRDFEERTQLGIDMLQHYRMWAERRDNFTPVYTEIDFELPLDGRDGGDFYVRDQLIVYAGRIDLVVKDQDGNYWVVDHKTAQNFSDRTYLDLDTQASSYLWAFRKQTGIKPKGIIFNQIKKTSPKKPSPLARGGLSKNKQQNTTYDLYMEAIEENGLNPQEYEDILGHLWEQEDKFVRRTWVDRSDKEMRRIEEVMRLEAEDMFNDPNIYPSPSPMNCNTCPYNAPCLAVQDGSDVDFLLDEGFVHGDKLRV